MKKFSALIICLLMILTCTLTGCAGFNLNKVKYYNEVVAKVGETNILRYELLNAYSSYGYSYYVSQSGQTEKQAMKSTLELLMDRESLYQYALTKPELEPTPYQVNQSVSAMFTSIDEQMDNYVKQAKQILKIKTEDIESEAPSDETAYLRTDYDYNISTNKLRRAHLVFDHVKTTYYTDETKTTESETETVYSTTENIYKIEYIPQHEESYDNLIDNTYLNDFNQEGIIDELIEKYFARFEKDLNVEGENAGIIFDKVISLLASDLLDYEHYLRDSNGKAYSKNTDDLIYRYFERNFNSQIKSQYLSNIRTNFLDNETFSIEDLEEKYLELYNASYQKFKNKPETYKTSMKDAGTSADNILYHPTLNDGTKFSYFVHTLLNFSETEKSQITALKELKNTVSETEYNVMYNQIISSLTVSVRDLTTGKIEKVLDETTNEEVDKKVTLAQVLQEYKSILNLPYTAKFDAFVDFMYKYTGDTATLSSGMPYVVGNNGYSAMEEAFTDEAVKLMLGSEGSMTSANLEDACVTSYGIHFLFYIGDVNKFDLNDPYASYINFSNIEGNNNNLYQSEINPITHKTYFDMLFDTVYPASSNEEVYTSNTGYSKAEKGFIDEIRQSNPAKIYKTKLKGTKAKI